MCQRLRWPAADWKDCESAKVASNAADGSNREEISNWLDPVVVVVVGTGPVVVVVAVVAVDVVVVVVVVVVAPSRTS